MLQVLFIRGVKDLDWRTAGSEPPTKHFVRTGFTLIGALLWMTAIVLMTELAHGVCVCVFLCVCSSLNLDSEKLRWKKQKVKWVTGSLWRSAFLTHVSATKHLSELSQTRRRRTNKHQKPWAALSLRRVQSNHRELTSVSRHSCCVPNCSCNAAVQPSWSSNLR